MVFKTGSCYVAGWSFDEQILQSPEYCDHRHVPPHLDRKGDLRSWRESSVVKRAGCSQAMVARAFNPSTWEAEAGGSLSSRTA